MNITVADFLASGFKHQLEKWFADVNMHIAANGPDPQLLEAMEVKRNPRTIWGVMTKEVVQARIEGLRPEDLLYHGLVVHSDGRAFFLSDDSQLGWKVLPRQFIPTTFSLPLRTAHKIFNSVEEFCAHFCRRRDDLEPELYLSNEEEIIKYVNENY